MKLCKIFRDYPHSADDLKSWLMDLYGLVTVERKYIANDSLIRFLIPVFFPTRTFEEVSYLIPLVSVRLTLLPRNTFSMTKEDWDSVFFSRDVDIVLFIV